MSNDSLTSLTTRFTTLTKRHLLGEVVALYLRGSAARNEQINGLSDVDFYMVVQDGLLEDDHSKNHFYEKLKLISDQIFFKWAQLNPSVRTVSLSNLFTNRTASFITGIDAQLLLGTDILGKIPLPPSKELSDFGEQETDRFLNYWVERSMEGKSNNLLDEVAYQQNVVLKLAQMALLSKGIIKIRKQDVADSFIREFPGFSLAEIVNHAKTIRLEWPNIPKEISLKDFIRDATIFPQTVKNHLSTKS